MVTATEQENYEDFDMIERWEELNLDESLLRGIFAEGFENPSFIQKRAIKPLLQGKDLRAQSQSGTGKTGAFCIAALQFVKSDEGTQVIVLAPTREIAIQNYNCLKTFSKFMPHMEIVLLLGGKEVKNDIEGLEKNPHIVVGTPGRIHHMMSKGYIKVKSRLFFIVDEADELFKRGFEEVVKEIFQGLNQGNSQVALFSATWEDNEIATSKKILREDAQLIDLRKDEQTLKGIDQYYIGLGNKKSNQEINDELKIRILIDIFSNFDINQCIIFVNGVERVKKIFDKLISYGFPCGSIHSALTQIEREDVFRKFKSGPMTHRFSVSSLNDMGFYKLIGTEEEAISFAQDHSLLKSRFVCCGKEAPLRHNKGRKNNGYYFRCNVKTCRKEVSVRKGSFFEGSHLTVQQILLFIYHFVYKETSLEALKRKCSITRDETVVDWLSYCREICDTYFLNHPAIIGGIGKIVEVDEMMLVRRKYNRGRRVSPQWVFGGYDVEQKVGFMYAVPDCTRESIFPIILEHIRPGSIIYSDGAQIYTALPHYGYTHGTVNHCTNFVDPVTGVTTNHVESMWQKKKTAHKVRYGTHRSTLSAHLGEFMWRQRFGCDLEMFFSCIREVYPIEY